MRYLLLAAVLLAGCATPQAPNPIAPIARVDLKPVKDRVGRVEESSTKIGLKLEDTRTKLDRAIVEAHLQKEQNAVLDATLQEASRSLAEAIVERGELANQIQFLKVDVDQAQEAADTAFLKGKEAVERANLAEGKVYKYELQEEEDEGNWGLNGVWRWTKHLGWRVIFLILAIGLITMALRLFAPAVIPIFTGIGRLILLAGRGFWSIISRLWQKKPPS